MNVIQSGTAEWLVPCSRSLSQRARSECVPPLDRARGDMNPRSIDSFGLTPKVQPSLFTTFEFLGRYETDPHHMKVYTDMPKFGQHPPARADRPATQAGSRAETLQQWHWHCHRGAPQAAGR